MHWMLSAIAAGNVPFEGLAGETQEEQKLIAQLSAGQGIRSMHARVLRQLTQWVEITGRPLHEQPPLVQEWERAQSETAGFLLRRFPAGKVTTAGIRLQAAVQCALTALAVERYRLAHGQWPRDLGLLVPAYLHAVPKDPYNGEPQRFRR
jgi:hypothetical protein